MPLLPHRRPRATALAGAAAVLGVALVTGCAGSPTSAPGASAPDGPLSVVASTNVWGDIASAVGGDEVEVTSFIADPSQDPHSYEASARNQLAVADAAVVIANGGGYDDFMTRMVDASDTSATVIDAVEVSGKTAPAGGELNEHVWYDMPTVAQVADRIATALGDADPAQARTFTANAEALKDQLEAITATEASVASTATGTGIGITEPVPLYMTAACGLVDATPAEFSEAVEEGEDVSPAVLDETQALYRDGAVQALVYNEQTTGAQTEAVLAAARDNGVAVVAVTETLPEGMTFVQWMTGNVESIQAAVTS